MLTEDVRTPQHLLISQLEELCWFGAAALFVCSSCCLLFERSSPLLFTRPPVWPTEFHCRYSWLFGDLVGLNTVSVNKLHPECLSSPSWSLWRFLDEFVMLLPVLLWTLNLGRNMHNKTVKAHTRALNPCSLVWISFLLVFLLCWSTDWTQNSPLSQH